MRVDKFTVKTKEALVEAQHLAAQKGQPEITPEHILLALLRQEGGTTTALLRRLGAESAGGGIDAEGLARQVEQHLDQQPRSSGGIDVGLSRKAKDLIETAEKEAERFKDEYTSTE